MLLNGFFDCVLMLTWSDWKTEPRSNRYHYASRFAKHVPVYFVQPDLPGNAPNTVRQEATELDNVTLWHVPASVSHLQQLEQKRLLIEALSKEGKRRPLIWIYNQNFLPLVVGMYGMFKVYHATEDYFSRDLFPYPESFREQLRKVLAEVDLLVSVSEGVEQSFRENGKYQGSSLVLPNGCDYAFFSKFGGIAERNERPVALFQGGINERFDVELMQKVADLLPNWEFRLCGKVKPNLPGFDTLMQRTNVRYLGTLSPEQVREQCHAADAGIIPYVQMPNIVERSLPIKAFEYVACGLPVVSVPIRALEPFEVFSFAKDAKEFAEKLTAALPTRSDPQALALRDATAKRMDYDNNFSQLVERVAHVLPKRKERRKNLLVLYDDKSTHVSTIREHLESFERFSTHRVFYAPATGQAPCPYELDLFDAVIVHYSIRLSLPDHLSPHYAHALAQCLRFKVLFIQDEYDTPQTARNWIKSLGINLVYTCVPEPGRQLVYPDAEFPGVRFVQTLTGFVPESYSGLDSLPVEHRKYLIGYRGRELPYWYGELGREKLEIGIKMREICTARNLPVNIEWSDAHRIYGPGWYEFVRSCRTMLGTESGSNVFDDTGSIRRAIESALAENPGLTYDEAKSRFLTEHEGRIVQNQISPKIFEAVAFRTGLVLYEGRYSDVVRPWEHFIPLKKDLSNVDEVLAAVQDNEVVAAMTERAYNEVIASGKYSYARFIEGFDAVLGEVGDLASGKTVFMTVSGIVEPDRYVSFAQHSPRRFMPSNTIQQGYRNDELLRVEPPVKGPNEIPALLKRLQVKTLVKYTARNIFMKLPAKVRKPIESPVKGLLLKKHKKKST